MGLTQFDWCPCKRKFGHAERHQGYGVHRVKVLHLRMPTSSKEERPQKNPVLLTP